MKDKMTSTDNKVTAHSLGSINSVKSLAKHNALYIYSTLTMMLFKLSERLFRLGLGEALPKNSNLSVCSEKSLDLWVEIITLSHKT